MMQRLFTYMSLILYHPFSAVSMKVSPCARWNKTGITVVGTGKPGYSDDQLFNPRDIFIHNQTNVLYVTDMCNNRIQMFSLDKFPSPGITFLSTKLSPNFLFVDDDDGEPTIYVSFYDSERIEKFNKNASSTVQVGGRCVRCADVSIDNDKNVYVIDSHRNCVQKWSPRSGNTTIVAGQRDKYGKTDEYLGFSEYIYVDRNTETVFVTDTSHHRIQKWPKDSKRGFTVAGSSSCKHGDGAAFLFFPRGLFVDEQTQVVYVADSENDRIQRWPLDALKGETITGGVGKGNAADELFKPNALAFDKDGNLYVCDNFNHRIQRFELIDNDPCPAPPTANTEVTTITTKPTTTTTTTMASHAAQLYRERYCMETFSIIMTLSIVQCIIMMQL